MFRTMVFDVSCISPMIMSSSKIYLGRREHPEQPSLRLVNTKREEKMFLGEGGGEEYSQIQFAYIAKKSVQNFYVSMDDF